MLTRLSITARTLRITTALPLLALLNAPIANAAQTGREPTLQARYERAAHDLRTQRWAAAYAGFVLLADSGHAPSAEMARWMHRQGATVFGSEWSASPDQQRRWNAMLANEARLTRPSDDLASAE
jgi:hypothetical protein